MILNVIFNAAAVFVQIFLTRIAAIEYDIVPKYEDIFSPCKLPNVVYWDDIADISKLNFETLNNGSIYVYGEATITRDLGAQDNPVTVEVFKKIRGDWISTVYNMYRDDFCKFMFNPTDIVYRYVMDMQPEDQTCPFYKGKKVYYNVTADLTLNIPNPGLPGDYKIQIKINFGGIKEVLCTNSFVEIYRH